MSRLTLSSVTGAFRRLASILSLFYSLIALSGTANGEPWAVSTRECPPRVPAPLQRHSVFGCPAPIDEGAAAQPWRWTPWTHAPACANATNEPERGRYCVYTNSRHGIGGMSLVTTPETAAAGIEILDEIEYPHPRADSRRRGNDSSESWPYEIVDMPGKGKGVVATRRIAQYEEFMVDYASLVVDLFFPQALNRADGYRLLHLATGQLSDPQRVLALGQSSSVAQDAIENVLRTNAFHTILGDQPHMALYPDVSRINHACKPNAFPRFMPRSMAVSVAASRDIEPGEEISISYITVGQTLKDRQAALERWEFKCSCALCTAPPDEIEASDARRLRIERLRDEVVDAYKDGDARRAVALTHEVLGLMRTEEMFPMYSEQYESLARIYWATGDTRNAERYARMSLDLLAEQGYIPRAQRNSVHGLLRKFAEEEEMA